MTQNRKGLRSACKEFEEDLVLYYYGEWGGAELARVEGHLKECAACEQFLEDLRAFLPLTAGPKEQPKTFWDSYFKEMQEKLEVFENRRPWWKRLLPVFQPWAVPVLGAALVVIIALSLTFTKSMRLKSRSSSEALPAEVQTVANNMDFFQSLDLLESIDLLEALDGAHATHDGARKL